MTPEEAAKIVEETVAKKMETSFVGQRLDEISIELAMETVRTQLKSLSRDGLWVFGKVAWEVVYDPKTGIITARTVP